MGYGMTFSQFRWHVQEADKKKKIETNYAYNNSIKVNWYTIQLTAKMNIVFNKLQDAGVTVLHTKDDTGEEEEEKIGDAIYDFEKAIKTISSSTLFKKKLKYKQLKYIYSCKHYYKQYIKILKKHTQNHGLDLAKEHKFILDVEEFLNAAN